MRIFWRTRRVRVHLRGERPSLEGFWIGNRAGHYVLAQATQIESEDRSFDLDGEAWIPAERVLYVQVVG